MNRNADGLWKVIVCALGVAAGAVGCGGPVPSGEEAKTDAELIASVCDQMCDCKTCSDSEATDCVNGGESLKSDAVEAGCVDEWSAYVNCLDLHVACDNGMPVPGQCGKLMVDFEQCVAAGKPPCDDLRNQILGGYEQCGVNAPETPSTCSAADQSLLECEVACVTSVNDCAIVTGDDAAGKKQLDDCMAACQP